MLFRTNLCAFILVNHIFLVIKPAQNSAESSVPQQEGVRVDPGERIVVFVFSVLLVSLSWKFIPGDPPDLSHRRSFSVFHPIPKGTVNK